MCPAAIHERTRKDVADARTDHVSCSPVFLLRRNQIFLKRYYYSLFYIYYITACTNSRSKIHHAHHHHPTGVPVYPR